MTAGFVAALLEGFECTLDAALEQIEEGELRREVEELKAHIATQRLKVEEQELGSWRHRFRRLFADYCRGN